MALGRVAFGLILVLAFSTGLAAALSGVGLLFVYAGRVEADVEPALAVGVVLHRAAAEVGELVELLVSLPGPFVVDAATFVLVVRVLAGQRPPWPLAKLRWNWRIGW